MAQSHVAGLCGLNPSDLTLPRRQGEQVFAFLGKDRVYRLARNQAFADFMPEEVSVLKELYRRTCVPTPEVLDFNKEKGLMCISRLQGESFSPESFRTLSPQIQEGIGEKIGMFLAQMHSFFPKKETIEILGRLQILNHIKAAIMTEANPQNLLRLREAENYMDQYGRTEGLYVRLHGDLHTGNIIHASTHLDDVGITDFGATKYGVPAYDFVALKWHFPERAYERAKATYEKLMQIEIQNETVQILADILDVGRCGGLQYTNCASVGKNLEPQRRNLNHKLPLIACAQG